MDDITGVRSLNGGKTSGMGVSLLDQVGGKGGKMGWRGRRRRDGGR